MKFNKLLVATWVMSVSTFSFSATPTVQTPMLPTTKSPLYAGLTVGYGTTTWDGLVGDPDEAFMMAISTPTSVNEGGTIGGAFVALLATFVMWRLWPDMNLPYLIGLGLITPLLALGGDLWESALKRNAGVKDSGAILPGHGGILDRYDSFLFSRFHN